MGSAETGLYWVRLDFPGTALTSLSEIVVARLPLPPSLVGFHGVIGRDLLGRWESFFYEGRRGRFTIRDRPPFWFRWLPWK